VKIAVIWKKTIEAGKSLQTRILVSFLLVLILPYTFAAYFIIGSVSASMMNQALQTEEAAGHQLTENLRNSLSNLVDFSTTIYFDSKIAEYFEMNYQNPGDSAAGYYELIRPLFIHYQQLYPGSQLTIYTKNNTLMFNDLEISYIRPGTQEDGMYRETSKSRGKVIWKLTQDARETSSLVLYRMLRLNDTIDVGMLAVSTNVSKFNEFMKEERIGTDIYLASPDGTIVTSTDESVTGKQLERFIPNGNNPSNTGSFQLSSGKRSGKEVKFLTYSFSVSPFDKGNWKIVKVVNTDVLLEPVSRSKSYLLITFIFIFIFAILTTAFISRGITNRIIRLVRKMKQVQQGDFTISTPRKRDDEMGYLEESFNRMVIRLGKLIDEVVHMQVEQKEMLIKKRDAELYALQSQINPHFLFNTLEAILYGIQENSKETSNIIQLLAKLLRRSIEWKRDLIPLEEELQFIRDYLTIQKYRMKERLEWEFRVEKEALNIQIPKMLLQVVVENAVVHGISLNKYGGTLMVEARLKNGVLTMRVCDNGIGMDEQKLVALRNALVKKGLNKTGHQVGLGNVADRFRLLFGENANINISSAPGVGTMVEFSITSFLPVYEGEA
jgi:two-component system sensor histidine kinase YesM